MESRELLVDTTPMQDAGGVIRCGGDTVLFELNVTPLGKSEVGSSAVREAGSSSVFAAGSSATGEHHRAPLHSRHSHLNYDLGRPRNVKSF